MPYDWNTSELIDRQDGFKFYLVNHSINSLKKLVSESFSLNFAQQVFLVVQRSDTDWQFNCGILSIRSVQIA